MSRHRRLIWIAVVVVLALFCAVEWWRRSKTTPEVVFEGFRERDGQRVAVFTLINNTAQDVDFESMLGISGAVRPRQFSGLWFERKPGPGFSGKRLAKPGGRFQISLQLTLPNGAKLDQPFRVRVDYHRDTIWSYPPVAWIPHAPKPAYLSSIWSDVVTP